MPAGYLPIALAHPPLGRPLIPQLAFGTEVPEIAHPIQEAGHWLGAVGPSIPLRGICAGC